METVNLVQNCINWHLMVVASEHIQFGTKLQVENNQKCYHQIPEKKMTEMGLLSNNIFVFRTQLLNMTSSPVYKQRFQGG